MVEAHRLACSPPTSVHAMFISDCGLVLQVVRYDDASSVVHVFTRSHGHVAFMATRPKSRRSPAAASFALLRPLSLLSFQWDVKPHATLSRMKDVHDEVVWQSIPYEPVKSAVALLLGEFLCNSLREEGENVPLFDFVVSSLRWYDAAPTAYANFHLVFLLALTHHLGISPDGDTYLTGRFFDIESGTFVPPLPASPFVLTPPDATLLYRLLQSSYSDMDGVPMNRTDRSRMITYIGRFYSIHVPGFPELKSLAVLETLFKE